MIISWRTEFGELKDEPLYDEQNILSRLLPSPDDETYQLLRFIDRDGLTVFNSRMQMPQFLIEWRRVKMKASGVEEEQFAERVEQFAQRVVFQKCVRSELR